MNSPPLNALRAFEVAARRGSFSQAGDEMHVTHAAISHQIKNLEMWFGVELFRREGRGVRLTEAGQSLFVGLSPLFKELSSLCARVKDASRRPTVVVGCIPSIASRWLVPQLPQFSESYPDVDIKVLYAQAGQLLMGRDLDVLVGLVEDGAGDVVCDRLFSRVNKPVCSRHYLEEHGPFDDPARIASTSLLHDETRAAWLDWFRTAGTDVPEHLTGPVFQDFNLLATSVIAGHGVALCPVEVFREEIARGDLIVLSDIVTNADKWYFITSKVSRSIAVENFVAWFIAATRGQFKKSE